MNRFSYRARLLLGLVHGQHAFAGPTFVNVDLTGRCNLACMGCPFHGPRAFLRPSSGSSDSNDLSFDMYLGLLKDLHGLGTRSIHLQGSGEPLLHPEVIRMIAEAKAMKFSVMLLTNGTLLDRSMCRELLAAGPDLIRVSFWATSPEEFRANAAGKDSKSFHAALEGLKRLSGLRTASDKHRTTVAAGLMVNRHNWTSLKRAAVLFADAGVDRLELLPTHPSSRDPRNHDPTLLTSEMMTTIRREADILHQTLTSRHLQHNLDWFLERLELSAPLWHHVPCYAGWFSARIGYQGEVRPCYMCSDSLGLVGNIHLEPFERIWNGRKIRDFRRRTRTRKSLASLSSHCNCAFCITGPASLRIHRMSRMLPRLA